MPTDLPIPEPPPPKKDPLVSISSNLGCMVFLLFLICVMLGLITYKLYTGG